MTDPTLAQRTVAQPTVTRRPAQPQGKKPHAAAGARRLVLGVSLGGTIALSAVLAAGARANAAPANTVASDVLTTPAGAALPASPVQSGSVPATSHAAANAAPQASAGTTKPIAGTSKPVAKAPTVRKVPATTRTPAAQAPAAVPQPPVSVPQQQVIVRRVPATVPAARSTGAS
jgi:hypothetical protein